MLCYSLQENCQCIFMHNSTGFLLCLLCFCIAKSKTSLRPSFYSTKLSLVYAYGFNSNVGLMFNQVRRYSQTILTAFLTDLGISINLKSADKDLKAVTPEKSKTCVTAFIKRLVTNFQLSRTRKGHFFLK